MVAPKDPYNLKGKRFGRLLVLEYVKVETKNDGRHWRCLCDCGNYKIVRTSHLTSGHTVSCGCRKEEVKKEIHKAHAAVRAKSEKKKKARQNKGSSKQPSDLMERLRKAEEGMAAFRLDNMRLRVQVNNLKKELAKIYAVPTPRYGQEDDPRASRTRKGEAYGTEWDDLY